MNVTLWSLLWLGVLLPTSLRGEIYPPFREGRLLVLGILLVAVLGLRRKFAPVPILIAVLLMNAVLSGYTLFCSACSFNTNYMVVTGAQYALLSLVYTISWKEIRLGAGFEKRFAWANGVLLGVAGLQLLGVGAVNDMFVSYYSIYTASLVENMLSEGKPVLSFGTHSIAAFAYYLLFYLNLRTYRGTQRKVHLVIALAWLVVCGFLQSVSGLTLLGIGIIQILWYLPKARGVFASFFAGALAVGIFYEPIRLRFQEWWLLIQLRFTNGGSGFAGRYSAQGVMQSALETIQARPISGVGVSSIEGLWWTDSGPLIQLLRGSVFLLVLFYGLLFAFFRYNLINKRTAGWLFLTFIAFEFGFPVLSQDPRTLFLLPFAVVYLNTLDATAEAAVSPSVPTNETGLVSARVARRKMVVPT